MRPPGQARLEPYRVRSGPFGSTWQEVGMCGAFFITHKDEELKIIACDGLDAEAAGWEHVSVSLRHRCPTWGEMEFVRELFWEDHETVLQFSVPRAKHINVHPFCLHLWRKIGADVELPPAILIAPEKSS